MVFALFLGAGNLIFPPFIGQASGSGLLAAVAGFLLTGVGLPLLGLVACARLKGGGLRSFTRDLPAWMSLATGLALYLSIGPLFALPRTAVVSWEMTLADSFSGMSQGPALYSALFFAATLGLALFPGKLIDTIGRIITPILAVALGIIFLGVLFIPQGSAWGHEPTIDGNLFFWGVLQGYQTMDALGALIFGVVIIAALQERGLDSPQQITRHTVQAGMIAALALAVVYIALAWLGATSHSVAPDASNGADILSSYVEKMFGQSGVILLGVAMTLACLTTAVGLVSACASYFNELMPRLGYKGWASLCALASGVVATGGLDQLLKITLPALMALYPFVVGLVLLALIRPRLKSPVITSLMSLVPVLIVGIIDGLSVGGVDWARTLADNLLSAMPLHDAGFDWVIPGLAGFALSLVLCGRKTDA